MKRPLLSLSFGLSLLFACAPTASNSATPNQPASPTPAPPPVTGQPTKAPDLAPILEAARLKYGLPSIAAVAVRDGRVISSAAVGERALGSGVAVTLDDAYHLGSLSKSFTATVLGKLVEDGKLRWDARLETLFPDIDMLPVFKSVMLEQLLIHTAGFSANLDDPALFSAALAPAEARARLLREALTTRPQYRPGSIVAYSNTGYIIASLIAERVTGQTWSELVTRYVLEPLNLRHCAFGVTFPRLTGPHPHAWDGMRAVPLEPALPNGNADVLNGADNVRCSLPDLGVYLAAHLAGERGENGILRARTFQELHRARANGGQGIYAAFGWFVFPDGARWHNGSNTLNYAEMEFLPGENIAVAVASNAPIELNKGVQEALGAVLEALRR